MGWAGGVRPERGPPGSGEGGSGFSGEGLCRVSSAPQTQTKPPKHNPVRVLQSLRPACRRGTDVLRGQPLLQQCPRPGVWGPKTLALCLHVLTGWWLELCPVPTFLALRSACKAGPGPRQVGEAGPHSASPALSASLPVLPGSPSPHPSVSPAAKACALRRAGNAIIVPEAQGRPSRRPRWEQARPGGPARHKDIRGQTAVNERRRCGRLLGR